MTDWLDGYLARRMNLSSPLGAFLDPVADKARSFGLSPSLSLSVNIPRSTIL